MVSECCARACRCNAASRRMRIIHCNNKGTARGKIAMPPQSPEAAHVARRINTSDACGWRSRTSPARWRRRKGSTHTPLRRSKVRRWSWESPLAQRWGHCFAIGTSNAKASKTFPAQKGSLAVAPVRGGGFSGANVVKKL